MTKKQYLAQTYQNGVLSGAAPKPDGTSTQLNITLSDVYLQGFEAALELLKEANPELIDNSSDEQFLG